jgi:aerobic carbon-monoxide dehydrogenase medium subunit
MKYIEALSLQEALEILAGDDEARCLAGGATLVAMMNADLIAPSTLISLRRIEELKGISAVDNYIRIGAMNTHTEVANAEKLLSGNAFVIRDAARQIAHPAIRNMGTIGGSICHADPASDFPGSLVAANAELEIIGTNGLRQVPAQDFFVDYLETSLEEGEVLTAILVPTTHSQAHGRHLKFSRTHGDYATVSVSLVLSMQSDVCNYARVAIGSVAPTPLHLDTVDNILTGSKLNDDVLDDAANLLQEACDPIDDVRGSAEYRRKIIPGLLKRAIAEALG